MKFFKKSLALTLAVLMLLTSMTVVSFADETTGDTTGDTSTEETFTPATKWLYLKAGTTTSSEYPSLSPYDSDTFNYLMWRNGETVNNTSSSATTNKSLILRTGSTLGSSNDTTLPTDYYFVRQPLSAAFTGKTGVTYEPLLTDTDNPYYEVWVDLTGHTNSYDVPLNIEIVGDDGTYAAKLNALSENTSGWHREMVKVGNIKLSDKRFNTISLMLPLDRTYYNKDNAPDDYDKSKYTAYDYLGFGGIKLIQLEGTPDELLPLERSAHVIEPISDQVAVWGGFASSNNNTYYGSDASMTTNLDDKYSLGMTDIRTERSYGTAYNFKGSASRPAHVYRGLWENSDSQAGWYKIYIDKIAHKDTTPLPYLTIQVRHADGVSEYIMDRNFPSSTSTWNPSRHYVGTFKMSKGTDHQIRICGPLLVDGESSSYRVDLGAIICVPVTEEEANAAKTAELTAEPDLYLKPVYSADFKSDFEDDSDNENAKVEYYANGGYHQLYLDAKDGEVSIQANYDATNADLSNALAFNEGIIDFDVYWNYTQGVKDLGDNTPYVSAILGKAADKSAEIRIYADKAQLIETNGETVTTTNLPIPTEYNYYLVTDNLKKNTLLGGGWKENIRIELTDVNDNPNGLEATSRAKSADGGNDKTKLLKVFINGLYSTEVCIGAAYIPAESLFYAEDNDLTDNYIKFVNNPGSGTTEQNTLIKIRNLSVAVPDSSITSADLVETVETAFTSDGKYKMTAYIPFKHSNKLGGTRTTQNYAYAIGAYNGNTLVDVDAVEKKIINGDKTTIDLSVDASGAEKVKLFKWKTFDDMVPYVAAEVMPE